MFYSFSHLLRSGFTGLGGNDLWSVSLAIWSLLFTAKSRAGHNESSVVLGSSSGSAGLLLPLFFGFDLWGLTLDFTSSRQGTVDFTSQKFANFLDFLLGNGAEENG